MNRTIICFALAKHSIQTSFAISVAALSLTSAAAAGDIKITNSSDWSLEHLYISETDKEEWGEDQLGDEIIAPGETFTLRGVPCATYDVKLIDEDGDECAVSEVDICGSGGWKIESDDLLACQSETEE